MMEKNKVTDLITYLKGEIKEGEKYKFESTIMYLEAMVRYFERVNSAKSKGKALVGHCVLSPIELIYAMDLVPLHLEAFCLFLNFFENLSNYLSIAAALSMPTEICSVHRVLIGMIKEKAYPKPDMLIWPSLVCDNTLKSGEGVAEFYHSAKYFLDHPYIFNEWTLEYYHKEMEGLVSFLETQTNQKLDYDKLHEVLDLSAQVTDLCSEIGEMRKVVPSPMPSESIFCMMAVNWLLSGTSEAVVILKKLRDECQENINKGIAGVTQERHRILFMFLLPVFNLSLMDWMEEEYGAAFVMCPQNDWPYPSHWYTDSSRPLLCLAKKYFIHAARNHFHGPMKIWLENVRREVEEYKPTGGIFFSHLGCRQACAGIRSLKDTLQELGIPMINVDCDLTDKSMNNPEEMKEKLEGFFEILEEKV
jgi:benzoyl-CoA reductase/2-hydroxyglutaryl-CoA dehydratase subunit BcrC/BadD/HgdB